MRAPPRSTRRVNPAAAALSPRRLCEPLEGVAFFTPLPLRLAAATSRTTARLPARSPPFFPALNPGFRSPTPRRRHSRRFALGIGRRFASYPRAPFSSRSSRDSARAPPPPSSSSATFETSLRTRASPTRRRAFAFALAFALAAAAFALLVGEASITLPPPPPPHARSARRRFSSSRLPRGASSRSRPLSANTAAAPHGERGIVAMHVNPPRPSLPRGAVPGGRRRTSPSPRPDRPFEIPQTNSALPTRRRDARLLAATHHGAGVVVHDGDSRALTRVGLVM